MSITQPPAKSATSSDSTSAAGEVLAHLERAWNDGDGHAFGAVFTEDADFVDIRGDHHAGRPAIAAGHQGIFDSIYRGSTVSYSAESAREVAPGVVVAVAGGRLEAPTGPLQGVHRSHFTLVLVERQGTWAVTAFQNTLLMEQR
jgi:uncharacterized protein (TIGR02246 family)